MALALALALVAAVLGAGTARASGSDAGPKITGTIARFYTGSTTGWEGSLLIDPTGAERRQRPTDPAEDTTCDRLGWNYGVTQGVEVNQSSAHYTEATVVMALSDACQGAGFPLAGVSFGAGTRYRSTHDYAGQQYTLGLFSLPWPFLEFYGRRIVHDARAKFPGKPPAVQVGIMFKIPIPLWGYHWGDDVTSPAP